MRHPATLWIMLGVLGIAALRIINIDGPALWTDEGFTYYTFTVDLFDALLNDRHPPFYFYTLHAWEALAGDSILALRFWSFLLSMLTVAVMFQVGRELTRYLRVPAASGALSLPVLAALMIALADAENYMAQELRMYTWHVLFSAGSTWFYLRLIRTGRRADGLMWVTVNVLSLHTHYFGAFVLAAQGLHALIAVRGVRRNLALGLLVLSGVLFMPWFYGVTVQQFADDAVCINCATSQNLDILQDFRLNWFGQMWPLTLGLFLLGLVSVRWRGILLLLGLLVLPVAGTFALGHDEAVLLARRMVQITVPVSVLIALGLLALRGPGRVLLVCALIVYGVTTIDWYRVKVPWHAITDVIAFYAQPDELALMDVGFEEAALLYYYHHRLPPAIQISRYPVWGTQERFDYYERQLPAVLAEQATRQAGVQTAWLTFFSPDDGIIRKLTEAGYVQTLAIPYPHLETTIDIYRYDRLPAERVMSFTNDMTLLAAEYVPAADDDQPGRLDLWWTADATLIENYVISAYIQDATGRVVAQYDAQPRDGARPTVGFLPGEVIYDPHRLEWLVPEPPTGELTLAVRVYRFDATGAIVNIPTQTGAEAVTVGVVP